MQLEKVQKTGKTNEMAESPRQHTTQRLADDERDAHDQFAFRVHGVDEFHWMLTGVEGLAELAGRSV